MSQPQVRIEPTNNGAESDRETPGDVEMDQGDAQGDGEDKDVEAPTEEAEARANELIEAVMVPEDRSSVFLDYLKSPIVELGIGPEEEQVTLSAHQALLMQSPYFVAALEQFSPDVTARRIEMPWESLDAMGCVLQYLYRGEYFPKRVAGNRLEVDMPDDGEQLLKHARVYTLAGKLELKDLEDLALSKVHMVQSSAMGEIEYARYVYGNTKKEDDKVRKPIAGFWGARSHILRHEAEDEFKKLCIEFPEFAFDVLTFVLDSRERRDTKRDQDSEITKSGRKRQRHA